MHSYGASFQCNAKMTRAVSKSTIKQKSLNSKSDAMIQRTQHKKANDIKQDFIEAMKIVKEHQITFQHDSKQ